MAISYITSSTYFYIIMGLLTFDKSDLYEPQLLNSFRSFHTVYILTAVKDRKML